MGADCTREQITQEQKRQKPPPYFPQGRRRSAPRNSAPRGELKSFNQTHHQNSVDKHQRTSKLKYTAELNQRQDKMLLRQKKLIKEKEQGAQNVRKKLEKMRQSGQGNELRRLKFQRQLKVYQDMIIQHRRNIQKIQKAEQKFK